MAQTDTSMPSSIQSGFIAILALFSVLLAVLTVAGAFPLDAQPRAAVVNGEVIPASEVQETYAQLPAAYKQQYGEQHVLEQLIDKTLILQEAQARGVVVSDEQVDAFIDEQAASFGISREQLAGTLRQGGITMDEYEQAVREELTLRAFVQQELVVEAEGNQTLEEQQALAAARFQALVDQLREEAVIVYGQGYAPQD